MAAAAAAARRWGLPRPGPRARTRRAGAEEEAARRIGSAPARSSGENPAGGGAAGAEEEAARRWGLPRPILGGEPGGCRRRWWGSADTETSAAADFPEKVAGEAVAHRCPQDEPASRWRTRAAGAGAVTPLLWRRAMEPAPPATHAPLPTASAMMRTATPLRPSRRRRRSRLHQVRGGGSVPPTPDHASIDAVDTMA